MDRVDSRKTDMGAEGLTAQPIEVLVGQVLDVPLYVRDAGAKSYRDTITDDGPVLDVDGKSARGAIRATPAAVANAMSAAHCVERRE